MADLVAAFFGSRGQGKSTQVHSLLHTENPPRLLIFDPMDEYRGDAEKVADLVDMGKRSKAERFRLRYVPPRADQKKTVARFDAFCSLAYKLGNLLIVCEELQLVTRPSYAPPAWSECTLRGRHRRLSIVGVSQRPASVDKNFFSCCTSISTGRLNFKPDQVVMADVLGVAAAEVGALARYHFIARNMDTGQIVRGDTEPLLAAMKGAKPASAGRSRKK